MTYCLLELTWFFSFSRLGSEIMEWGLVLSMLLLSLSLSLLSILSLFLFFPLFSRFFFPSFRIFHTKRGLRQIWRQRDVVLFIFYDMIEISRYIPVFFLKSKATHMMEHHRILCIHLNIDHQYFFGCFCFQYGSVLLPFLSTNRLLSHTPRNHILSRNIAAVTRAM